MYVSFSRQITEPGLDAGWEFVVEEKLKGRSIKKAERVNEVKDVELLCCYGFFLCHSIVIDDNIFFFKIKESVV
jgi:hypothetical protein